MSQLKKYYRDLIANCFKEQHFTSSRGYRVDMASDYWQLSSELKVPIFKTAMLLDKSLVEGFYQTIRFYAMNYSPSHATNLNQHFHTMLTSIQSNTLTETDFLNYRAKLNSQNEWKLGALVAFFKKWQALGYQGPTKQAIELLDKWRFKGNKKGHNVMSLDPQKGPLTDQEHHDFLEACPKLFSLNSISLQEFCTAWIVGYLPVRKAQFQKLRVNDFQQKDDGTYVLMVPRAKQRGLGYRAYSGLT